MTESVIANEMIELGEMRMAREALFHVIRNRFAEILTEEVERAIIDQPSVSLMKTWFNAAVDSKTADEFLAVLRR